ncbi:MAG: N-acetylmuramoyl-L-alanine amidase [Clostridia bacterium]|nr:N-acetylmuramoyl-L-alanine amidase [Clostridia bacterium]
MYKIYLSPSTQDKSLGVGKYGTEEYRMNMIADVVERILVGSSNFVVYRNRREMSRDEIIKESNILKVDIHVAIHSNYGGSNGPECFPKVNCERSNGVAKEIYKHLKKVYYDKETDNGITYSNNIIETMNVNSPSVLVEVGYHDNMKDAEWIVDNIYIIGEAIAYGIIEGMKLKVC